MVWTFWNKYRKRLNFLDKLKRYKYECQTRSTVPIRYSSYKGYRTVPSLESYTSSPLELRLELQLDIGSDHGYLDYEPRIFGLRTTDIWITNHGYLDYEPRIFGFYIIGKGLFNGKKFHHRWINLQKDCFTIVNPRTVIYLDYMCDFPGVRFGNISLLDSYWLYWTLADK